MIHRAWALCVLIPLVVAGGAQAHDSGPAIARAIVALQQGPISYDPASPVSELQADAVNQRLGRSSDIAIAILPVDFSLSAVGAARELDLHLDRPGTIVTVLGETWERRARTWMDTCSARSCATARPSTTATGRFPGWWV